MTVVLTKPELWEKCKQAAVEEIGAFNNRAMQSAVAAYKNLGGGYVPKTEIKEGEIPVKRIGKRVRHSSDALQRKEDQ